MYVHVYIYICICIHEHMYMYIYIYTLNYSLVILVEFNIIDVLFLKTDGKDFGFQRVKLNLTSYIDQLYGS